MERHVASCQANEQRMFWAVFPALVVLTLLAAILSAGWGRYGLNPREVIGTLLGLGATDSADGEVMRTVLWQVRLPRVFSAFLTGMALSVAGTAYQALFRNPMVSPDILGASSGAGFGAALGILAGAPLAVIQAGAFLTGLAAVFLAWGVASLVGRGHAPILALVLAGMVVSSLGTSFTSLAKFVADPYSKLPAITFWLMGGLSGVTLPDLSMATVPVLLGLVPLFLLRWRLNVLAFGDDEARSLGVNTGRLRLVVIVCATLMTSAAVSMAGMVGWVGLVIPHLARMLVGPDCRRLLPASALMGGTFLLVVDDIARCAMEMEVPLGILTALVGAPFFLILLLKGRKGWVA